VRVFRADLHIHSCLSPCADLDMSPRAIVEKSLESGLDIIAVCDHNSAENVGAVMRAGSQRGIHVIPGMEINSREEVHTLAFFDTEMQALKMQELIYRHLRGTNRPELFGDQVVANEFDEVEGFNDRLLIAATGLALDQVVKEVHRLGGLTIASHVDRPSFSILGQLGFIPPDMELDGLELSRHLSLEEAESKLPEVGGFTLVSFSDAHFLDDIGQRTTSFVLEAPSLTEIRMALREESGRKVVGH
jgi:PHP family Zn ribbon phosphoesterase